MDVIIRSGALKATKDKLFVRVKSQDGDVLSFRTYDELSNFCYPYSKNLSKGLTDTQKYALIYFVSECFHQKVLLFAEQLGYAHFLDDAELHIINERYFLGFNGWYEGKRIIALDISLICYNPLVLTEVIIHELTHFKEDNHKRVFYDLLEVNVGKCGLQKELYGRKEGRVAYFPTSIMKWHNEIDYETEKLIRTVFRFKKERVRRPSCKQLSFKFKE